MVRKKKTKHNTEFKKKNASKAPFSNNLNKQKLLMFNNYYIEETTLAANFRTNRLPALKKKRRGGAVVQILKSGARDHTGANKKK